MVGQILPVYGGTWVPDTGGDGDQGGGRGQLPPGLVNLLEDYKLKGVVISGVVTWVAAQIDTQTTDAWKSLAERCFRDSEISEGKEALKLARGAVLETLVPEFKLNRKGGSNVSKKAAEIEDIRKALVALQSAGEMPLVIASSGQMVRCPQSWGVPESTTLQDVMGKVIMLEQVMTDSIKNQKESMEELKKEVQV